AKAPASGSSAAVASAAALSAAERRKRRRKRGGEIKDRAYADEFMDYEATEEDPRPPRPRPEPTIRASERGAGPMGFTGAVGVEQPRAAGLAELTEDSFGGAPTNPMLPGSWSPDDPPTSEGGRPH
ncbi:PPW family C-terminal domain-containing PPE protein, partial [Mycolicibacterium sp. A43C]